MRFISTRVHGMLDYPVSLVLIFSPWIFGLPAGPASQVPFWIGIGGLLSSLMTQYELGLVKVIPMSAHLALDVITGIILAISPWAFGFATAVYLPHLILGLVEIGAGLMTETTPHSTAATTAAPAAAEAIRRDRAA